MDLNKFFKNKKVFITGHTGFKGSWLSQVLIEFGAKVTGYSLKPVTHFSLFNILKIKKRITHYVGDIRDYKKLKSVIEKEKPEIIFHLAAQSTVREGYNDPLYTFETNIMGTANLLQAIKEVNGVKSVVIVTTDKVYKNKEKGYAYKESDRLGGYGPYSSSKVGAEIIVDSYRKSFFNLKNHKKSQLLIVSARAGNAVGGGDWQKDRLIPDIVEAIIEKNKEMVIRNPQAVRPWQFVLEPLYGYMLLAEKLYEGKKEFSDSWNFGPNKENFITVKELIDKALFIFEKGSYVVKKNDNMHEAKILKLNINKAKNKLKWFPVFDINTVLQLTFDWYKNFYERKDMISFTNQQIELFFKKINLL